jgi:hypothetical protein
VYLSHNGTSANHSAYLCERLSGVKRRVVLPDSYSRTRRLNFALPLPAPLLLQSQRVAFSDFTYVFNFLSEFPLRVPRTALYRFLSVA